MTEEERRLIRRRSLGANLGATSVNDFPRRANGSGQADGDHASSQTDPDDAERLTGIYGSVSVVPGGPGWTAARIGAGGLGDSLRIWPRVCVPFF